MSERELTPREVAERLGVTARTVQRWIADGRLPAHRVGGRHRVRPADLHGLADEAAQPAAPPTGIGTLLVANRGEIVSRIARTARALGMRVLATVEPGDRRPHGVDGVVEIGSYLDAEEVVGAARAAGAHAVHPGYGFLAESPLLAALVPAGGMTWVGPPAAAIAAMGDKAAARRTAAEHGVPVLPGYDGRAQDEASLAAEATRIGYPLLIKPSAGGGGKGMRTVRSPEELPDALAGARREAERAFGDGRLVLERHLDDARHVEIQVLADRHGAAVHLGERDCSTQRRHQKVVEEAPGPVVEPQLREQMGAAALSVASAVGYVGAGTVEFLLAPDGRFYFLEMNTRLQVEHPVTELVTGRDLVADQLRIAVGEPLGFEQRSVSWRGHAIEARVYAEEPEAGYLPQSGAVARLRWPQHEGVRVDAGVVEGDVVSDRYDPMLAKLAAHGADRHEALSRLRRALDDTLLLGVRTNLRFLRWLLHQAPMVDGQMRVDTLDSLTLPQPAEPTEEAWLAAARHLHPGSGGAWSGGWRLNAAPVLRLACGEVERSVRLGSPGSTGSVEVAVVAGVAHVAVDGQSLAFRVAPAPSVEAAVRHAAQAGGESSSLTAPMPGRVVAVRAGQGDDVAAHQPVVVIEAMKMEHAVVAPVSGRLVRLHVSVGDQVERGQLLAEVESS